ncbi:MAG: DMT family transporter [Clostridiales bacterium]|nr:DMT family transporter [Clostridiales bacterium]
MRKNDIKGIIILFLTAIIWGSSFVAQSVGMEKVQAFTFNGIRTLMGSLFLLVFILIRKILKKEGPLITPSLLKKSLILGLVFVFASNLQQYAFYYSTAGKIAFITALYMFFVPLIGIFIGRKSTLITWICVFVAIFGLYLLSVKGNDFRNINKGDLFALGCAFFFAIHILLVDRFVQEEDGIKLSCFQFFIAGSITLILMFIFEEPVPGDILLASKPLLYSGIMSCGVAYTFQILGQKYTSPVVASIIMSMESVFAVLSAVLFLHEGMSIRESLGCLIMFGAIIISQLSEMNSRPSEA